MGLSERAISETIWLADIKGKNTLYAFPTQHHLQEFVQARLNPVLNMSDYLKDKVQSGEGKKVETLGLKKIGLGDIYFRGSTNEKQIITVDADMCLDDKTEILTNRGWKLFKELNSDDVVATLDRKGYLEYQKPKRLISYYYSGELISVENQQVNFVVTPGHNLYVRKQRQKEFNLIKVDEIFGCGRIEFKKNLLWKGDYLPKWTIPSVNKRWKAERPNWGKGMRQKYEKNYKEKIVDTKLFLEFIGIYIAEGSVSKQHGCWYNVVRIAQNKGVVFDRITNLLDKLGFKYKQYPSYLKSSKCYEIRIYNTQLASYLSRLCGIGSNNKKITKEILKLDSRLLKFLFKGLMAGDGSNDGSHYYTKSRLLRDSFEELLLKIGLVGRSHSVQSNKFICPNNHKQYISKPIFVITINHQKLTPRINKKDWGKIKYRGMVYCVSVPNKIIYVKRNNSSLWIGNCIMDERDRFVVENVPFLEKRLLASDLKWMREISTPTLPKIGIHASYIHSDMRVWQVQCKKCGLWQELDLFKNVDFTRAKMVCSQCKKKIKRFVEGRWFITNPKSKIHGYKINGLYNPSVTTHDIIMKYKKARRDGFSSLQQFFNQNLGLPYEVTGKTIQVSELDNCQKEYEIPIEMNIKSKYYAGIDIGAEAHHTVVVEALEGNRYRVVWAGLVKDFFGPVDSIEQIMNAYMIKLLVVDRDPEKGQVRQLIAKFPGKVFAASYPSSKFTVKEYFKWDLVKYELKLDRTISLDYVVSDIQNRVIELPRNIGSVPGFYGQLRALTRTTQKNKRTGEELSFWVETQQKAEIGRAHV